MSNKIELSISEDDPNVAYVSLPNHPGQGTSGASAKQIRLSEEISNYKGMDIILDLDKDGEVIGIEIVG